MAATHGRERREGSLGTTPAAGDFQLIERLSETTFGDDVREVSFALARPNGPVAGVLWHPVAKPARGLVLFGHGFTHDRRSPFLVPWAQHAVQAHGLAAAAIDAPCHGERRAPGDETPEQVAATYQRYWRENGGTEMAGDLSSAAAALLSTGDAGPGPLAYWGLSLGTQYGLAYLTKDTQPCAAMLGLFGLAGPRVEHWARQVRCPVYFVAQQEDELHSLTSVRALYDEIPGPDKTWRENPGAHAAVPVATCEEGLAFLAERIDAAR